MGTLFSKPLAPPAARKPRQCARLGTEEGQHNVPAAQVLHGAHGVQFSNSPVTVAGRDVNNITYVNNINSINHNTLESAASTDAEKKLFAKILEYFGIINFRGVFDENLAKRTPDTGREVIDSEWFQEWLMNLLGGIVWGTGMPGAGKTVLACIVIDYIQKTLIEKSKSQDICLLFAFCRYTEQLMVIDILFAILRQLLERYPQVLPYVKPMYERHERENTRPSEAEVVDLLKQIASSGLFKQTFYILDGLDEAASDIQVDLLEILSSLHVNFFITSRPLDSIKDLVPNARFITVIASDTDIALLIDQKIHRMSILRKLLMKNATLKAEVVSIINLKSSGMFLLASLHLDMLKECASESDIRNALEGLPRGMDGMYDATMDRIKAFPGRQADLAKRVLIWVTYAQRPLAVEELVLAVSVCPDTFRFNEELEPAGIDSILSLCCGLIQVEASTGWYSQPRYVVRFVHYSTAEYLTKRLEAHYPDDPHALIASTCVAFLRHYGFHDMWSQCSHSLSRIPSKLLYIDENRTSMANYPYEHWALHVTKSKTIPAPALAFIDDCKHYPACYEIQDMVSYQHELPSFPGRRRFGCRVETLQSVHVAAIYGIHEYFNRLEPTRTTKYHTSPLNSVDTGGSTPLILASMAGREDVVAFLMGAEGVNVNRRSKDKGTALFVAVANRHAGVVKTILSKRGVNVNRRSQRLCQDSPLTLASQTGQRDIVQLLLDTEGIDINLQNGRGKTALYLALRKGHQDIVRMLLQTTGTNILGAFHGSETRSVGSNKSRSKGLSPTGIIVLSETIMNVLNSRTLKFDFNAKDNRGRSALAYSLEHRSFTEVAQALFQIPGIDVNSADKGGRTIMMLALCHGTDALSLVETVIKLGGTSDINAKDRNGQTALSLAASEGSRKAVTMLLGVERIDYNCVDAYGQTALMKAADGGHIAIVALLLELEGVYYNCVDDMGQTALMRAARNGRKDVVALLLGVEGINYNCVDIKDQTALSLVAEKGWEDTIALLLKLGGVNYHCVDTQGQRALMMAAGGGHGNTVSMLLGLEGVDHNYVDAWGRTPLMMAAQGMDDSAVAVLLQVEGIKIDCRDDSGKTALAYAISLGRVKTFEALLKVDSISADYTTIDRSNYLMLAAGSGNASIIRSVLQLAQFDINARDLRGRTALTHAIMSLRGEEPMQVLLEAEGIDVHIVDQQGMSPLMHASRKGTARMVDLLLGVRLGANINAMDMEMRTVLFHAASRFWDNPDIVSALLKVEGIDCSLQDLAGRTPLMVAIEKRNDKSAELLRQAGG